MFFFISSGSRHSIHSSQLSLFENGAGAAGTFLISYGETEDTPTAQC